MRLLLIHNYYQQAGGEDQVFEAECRLLEQRGHAVTRYTRHNKDIAGFSMGRTLARTMWSTSAYQSVMKLVRQTRIELVHCHNTFPLISPAVYWAARAGGAAVVQTLHNYRLGCVNALLFRGGAPCELCVGRTVAWPGIRYQCYRRSRGASAAVAAMVAGHRAVGTWSRAVDRYIALTGFARSRLERIGLPPAKIVVKPNFLDVDPGPGTGGGGYVLFVGRLSEEKGIDTLIEAWRIIGARVRLWVVGDGPASPALRSALPSLDGVEWKGRQPFESVTRMMGNATALVFPSRWYEGMPRTIVEALARGTPVVASRLGSMAELVEHERTGLLFEPGDASDLARQVLRIRDLAADLRSSVRREFEARYTAERGYEQLMNIYHAVCEQRSQ